MGFGDEEGVSCGHLALAEWRPSDGVVVARSRRLEVGEVHRVVHVAQRVGVSEPDLDGVLEGEWALGRPAALGHAAMMTAAAPGRGAAAAGATKRSNHPPTPS